MENSFVSAEEKDDSRNDSTEKDSDEYAAEMVDLVIRKVREARLKKQSLTPTDAPASAVGRKED